MHPKVILFVFIVFPSTFALPKPASILDLLPWHFGDESEVEKRDDVSDTTVQKTCSCDGPTCMCCVDFNITFIDLGGPGCVHMKFISQEEGIAVNVSYGENLLHSEQVKGPNPEPTCMSLLSNLAQVCARFSDLHPSENGNGLKGCLQLEPMLLDQVQTHFDIGCFTIGPNGMKMDPSTNFTTALLEDSNKSQNGTQAEQEELNEEELIAAVNETAEQGLVFIGNWLGLFGNTDVNATNSETRNETNSVTTESSSVSTITLRKARLSSGQNQI